MVATDGQGTDWARWLRRWDAQQEGYVPDREARFTIMLDALEAVLPPSFVALDLACGPGSISQRLLARFPDARAVAVDMDPVMLAVGQGALGTVDGRVTWLEADLADPAWTEALEGTTVDAVLSATALHWLSPGSLIRVYHDLAGLLRPGGLFLNADHLPYTTPTFARLSGQVLDAQWSAAAFAARGIETAEQWWSDFAADPAHRSLMEAQARRFAGKERPTVRPGAQVHAAALREAGFAEVDTLWQVLSDRVLMAVR